MQATRINLAIGALALTLCVGCLDSPRARVHADSTEADSMLARIADLAGDWEMTDQDGNTHHAATFAVTAAGSAVREIMFPGSESEMTNLYHMDGNELVITHYCAGGNQPRMVASEAVDTDEGTAFRFDLDRVSNLRESHDHYMGNMTLTILAPDRVRAKWRSYDRAGQLTDPIYFLMTRKIDEGDAIHLTRDK